jgi:N-acetylmuramoyl-L-alanine amidase
VKRTFFAFLLLSLTLTVVSFTVEPKKAVKTIIIDPGHGGADPGAGGLISTEAQLSLSMSKKLGDLIQQELPGVKVLFTRTTDIIPGNSRNKNEGLRWRANFANQSKADLFISIHCNSAGRAPGGWYEKRIVGYDEKETFTGKGKKKKKKTVKVPVYESFYVPNPSKGTETFIWTAKENSHKGELVGTNAEFDGYEGDSSITVAENDPVLNALKLLYTKKYFLNSLRLAEMVQQEFEKAGRINRGVKQRNDVGIWVLHATGMPSILVEAGFISNKEEEEYMNTEEGQNEIARNILVAVKRYIDAVENPKKSPENESTGAVSGEGILLNDHRKKLFLS